MRASSRRHGSHRRRVLVWLVACALGAAAPAVSAPPTGFRLVAHPGNAEVSVERQRIADVFLQKSTRWPDGSASYPVDQSPESGVRQRFSEQVLRRSVFAVRSYWQQRIFSGRGLPPPELASDDAVLGYVRSHSGAVGYVSEQADVSGVKVLSVR